MHFTRRRRIIALIVCLILLLPIIGMSISEQVKWDLFDFLIAAVLLLSFGCVVDFACGKIQSRRARIISLICIILVFFLIWGELAVGLFGTPWAGN
jgi:hypothetical protein